MPVRSCVRRGAAIDLVLDRGRENRSQFVFTRARGREVIFWQSARTDRQARPNVAVPTRRAAGPGARDPRRQPRALRLEVRRPAGDDPPPGAARRRLRRRARRPDRRRGRAQEPRRPASTVSGGKLRYLLAALAERPRAALVVEDRYSAVFKLDRVRPAVVAEGLAEAQVRFPDVPIVFCETRPLAQEWTYRFLGAAASHHDAEQAAARRADLLPDAGPLAPPEPTAAEVRAWAVARGMAVAPAGRVPASVRAAYAAAHGLT